jgi:WD40 repeat protein
MVSLDINPAGTMMAGGPGSSPFLDFYTITDGGSKVFLGSLNMITPATAAGSIAGLKFSPDGNFIFTLAGSATPYLQGWYLDRNTNAVAFSNPGTLPGTGGIALDVHPAGTHVSVITSTTPFIYTYPYSSSGFGTILTAPTTVPAGVPASFAFSPHGDYIAISGSTSPYVQVYPFSQVTGYGATPTSPGSFPGTSAGNIAWRPQGDFLAIAYNASPWIAIYAFNRSSGTFGSNVYSAPTGGPTSSPLKLCWSPDGNYLLAGIGSGGGIIIMDFSALTIASPVVAYDGTAPAATVQYMKVHPNGENFSFATSSNLFTYAMPRKVKNYLKITD